MTPADGPPRPATLVVVAGTGTDVGKTWVSVRLLEAWRAAGRSVAARKPAQSWAPGSGPTDADRLGAATGEDPAVVCPAERSYPVPMAPPMAAAAAGRPVPTLADLVAGVRWPSPAPDVGLVETAGGVRSPQADDADVLDVVGALGPDHVVLVADAGLGTVNAVRLSVGALAGAPGPVRVTVVLNRFDPDDRLHRANRAWLAERDHLSVVPAGPATLAALAGSLAGRSVSPPARGAGTGR